MVFKIKWTKTASRNYDNVVAYLRDEFSERSVEKFTVKLLTKIETLQTMPTLGKVHKGNVRRLIIVKQCSVFYDIREDFIAIINVFDNRQNPNKQP